MRVLSFYLFRNSNAQGSPKAPFRDFASWPLGRFHATLESVFCPILCVYFLKSNVDEVEKYKLYSIHSSVLQISHTLNNGTLQPRRLQVVQVEEVQESGRVPETYFEFWVPLCIEDDRVMLAFDTFLSNCLTVDT